MKITSLAALSVLHAGVLLGAGDETISLTPMKVSAFCPIVKIAEYKLSVGRKGAAIAADGDYIYIVGGENANGDTLDTIERFNIRTHSSESFAKLKIPRVFHSAVLIGRKLYVLGGQNIPKGNRDVGPVILDSSRVRTDRDANTDPGARKNRSSKPRYASDRYLDSVECIDLDTGEQGNLPSMPVGKAFFGGVAYKEKIYVIGGKKAKSDYVANTNSVEIFDTSAGTWTDGIPMPTPRQCMAVRVDDFIITAGGYNGRSSLATVEFFNPNDNVWRILPPLESQVSASATVRFGKYIVLFGDYDNPSKVVIYDLSNRHSETFSFSYTPGRHASAVTHDNRIYIVGGATASHDSALDVIQVFASVDDQNAKEPSGGAAQQLAKPTQPK